MSLSVFPRFARSSSPASSANSSVASLSLALLLFLPSLAFTAEGDGKAILASRCLRCHGGDAVRNGVDFTAANAWQHQDKMLSLIREGKMPMGGKPLTSEETDAVAKFLSTNPAPLAKPTTGRKLFWSFRTPVLPPVPELPPTPGIQASSATPIDRFILAKLREKGLSPAPPADAVTLRRRLAFDLTGLPPTKADLQLPYPQLVDKLLSSRQYAERWARHWLDVVRFGETDGGEHNYERFHAWPYRDYVIESLHADKPYHQFLKEQVAGDLLAPYDPKMVAATGFLVAGPWDQVQAEINKDKAMAMTQRMDELDDMVTTVFHTFQAMTVNCARCHDHKFDPIPTRDYYKLTAAFQGVGFGTRQVATPEQLAEREAKVKPLEEQKRRLQAELGAIENPIKARLLNTKYRAFEQARAGEAQRLPLNPVYNHNRFAPITGGHWRLVITGARKAPRLAFLKLLPQGPQLAAWAAEKPVSPDAPVLLPLGQSSGEVRELEWASDAANGQGEGQINVYRLEHSPDGQAWKEVASSLDHVQGVELDLPEVKEAELVAQLTPAQIARRQTLQADLDAVAKTIAAIPTLPQVYAAKPPKQGIQPSFVLDRGAVTKPGEAVHAGALSAIKQLSDDFGFDDKATDAQRRLALADWLTSEKNPLTARVIVNRVWYFHFGTGIVNTPSDFGLNGDRPSHPELLDWLAVQFMQNNWSLKWLHRQILLSSTYQQSAQHSPEAHAVDADNRLYWHMPLRRMDAEMLRDNILYAAGNLDLAHHGGPSFNLQKKIDSGSYIYKALDNDGPAVWKRAVYRFVVRGGERIFLDSFDCPDPAVATPQRSLSNTPVQALTLLNNEFVWKQSQLLAAKLARLNDPVGELYSRLYGRQPTLAERQLAKDFLASQKATSPALPKQPTTPASPDESNRPLALLTRALFNASEFLYVP